MTSLTVCLALLALCHFPESNACARTETTTCTTTRTGLECAAWRNSQCQYWKPYTQTTSYTTTYTDSRRQRRSILGIRKRKCSDFEYVSGFRRVSTSGLSSMGRVVCRGQSSSNDTTNTLEEPVTVFLSPSGPKGKIHMCPEGFFFRGYYPSPRELGHTRSGRCSRPATHPSHFEDCYMQNMKSHKGGECRDNYFVAALVTGRCGGLHVCPKSVRCCSMANRVSTF